MKIRHEINILNTSSGQVNNQTVDYETRVAFDESNYNGNISTYLEVVTWAVSPSVNGTIHLMDSANNIVVSISVPDATSDATRTRSATINFTGHVGPFWIRAVEDNGYQFTFWVARLIIIQDTGEDDLTETVCQFEVGMDELRIAGEPINTYRPWAEPKYWKYEADKWDGIPEFKLGFTFECEDYKEAYKIALQEDDGNFSWQATYKGEVDSLNNEDPTYFESDPFTPSDGKHYRLVYQGDDYKDDIMIYNAKVIVKYLFYEYASEEATPTVGASILGGDGVGSGEAVGQSVTVPDHVSSISFVLKKEGSPTDNLNVKIASSLNGSVIATSDPIDGATLTTDPEWYNFEFATPVSLIGGNEYYFRVERSGSRDGTNYYWLYHPSSSSYADGVPLSKTEGIWYEGSVDNNFILYGINSITKLQEQYLLINKAETSGTGLKDFDTYFDPAEWDGVDNAYFHAIDASQEASNVKLQEDPNGTPADIDDTDVEAHYIDVAKHSIGGIVEDCGFESTTTYGRIYGGSGTEEELAQSFQVSQDTIISGLVIWLSQNNSPTDTHTIKITSTLGGSALISLTFDPSEATGVNRYQFDNKYKLNGSTTYYIEISRSGARDTSNWIKWNGNLSNPYSNGIMHKKESGSWSDVSGSDLHFHVLGETQDMPATAEEIDAYVVAL